MSDIIPELLWLKYRGVRSPWEIARDSKRFGYKCRKYARWEAVHVTPASADLLRKVGDDLLNGEGLSIDDFGHLSCIWERVQRWTKDKEGLSLEPDKYAEFETLERLLIHGSREQGVVDGVLREVLQDYEQFSDARRWSAYKCICLGRFVIDGARCDLFTEKKQTEPTNSKQLEKFEHWIAAQIPAVYDALGFSVSASSPIELIDLLLAEMGLATEFHSERRANGSRLKNGPPSVIVEQTKRNDLRIAEAKMQAGTMVIKLNGAHPAFQANSPFYSMLHSEQLWNCFGLACRDNLGQIDELQSYFDSLGIHLASATRMLARAAIAREG